MRSFLIGLIPFLLLCSCQPKEVVMGDLLIKNVNIVDVVQSSIIKNQYIVISGGRIIHIDGNQGRFEYRAKRTVDLAGSYVIPGLWDMHAHPDDPELWRMGPKEREKELLLPLFVINGVTGIRDMGGDIGLIKKWKEQGASGRLTAPRIVAGGPLLDGPDPMWDGSVGINGPEEVPEVVDSLITAGVDFLKVYSLLPRDTYFALSEYANKIGFPFAGHVPFTVLPSEAANSGMRSQEHLLQLIEECAAQPSEEFLASLKTLESGTDRYVRLTNFRLSAFDAVKADSLYELFAKTETYQCPTLSMWYKNAWYEEELAGDSTLLDYLPGYLRTYWTPGVNDHLKYRDKTAYIATKKKLYAHYLKMVQRMHEKGVKLLAGTDTGANPLCFPGTGLHNELFAFVEAGLSPAEALKTATIHPAEFLGMENEMGSVAAGKHADLLILDGNPLADIYQLRKIRAVINKGILFTSDDLDRIKNEIKTRFGG